jgi:hypothetical protein
VPLDVANEVEGIERSNRDLGVAHRKLKGSVGFAAKGITMPNELNIDTLIKDYGCGQIRHNGRHAYCTGEHFLFNRIDAGMTVSQARKDFYDEYILHSNFDLWEFSQRWSGFVMRVPLLGFWPVSPQYVYSRLR